MKAELRAAKLLMADRNFEGEFTTLLKLALGIAEREGIPAQEATIRAALRELLVAFPVYRTYGTKEGLPPADAELLQKIVVKVKASATAPDPDALDFITGILAGLLSDSVSDQAALFRTRFQQLTGPLMAKLVEDTLFFRQNMGLALNEVGAEPLRRAFSLERFHDEMKTRLEKQPDALSGTSTHDTKRGEDTRARLYTLTEAPSRWAVCVARWQEINQHKVVQLEDGPAPKPAGAWMLFQALAGVWPVTLQPDDAEGLKALEARFLDFVEKALREAKLRTDWVDSNDPFEKAMLDYARHLLSPDNQAFLQDFVSSLQPFIRAGLVNSLTQTVIKLTAPGVPDIYQGSEALNFSLVDPDNRREPDFATLTQQLVGDEQPVPTNEESWQSGLLKQQVIAKSLRLRQQKPALFRYGDYLPLTVTGERADHVIAYARVTPRIRGGDALIVIAPRLALRLPDDAEAAWFTDTTIALPEALAGRRYRNILSGDVLSLGDRLDLTNITGDVPQILIAD